MKNNLKNTSRGHIIPQINDNVVGIRSVRNNSFVRSEFVSAVHGHDVVDKIDPNLSTVSTDVDTKYDSYRETRKISDEELIEKYGTKYFEFEDINSSVSKNEASSNNIVEDEEEEINDFSYFINKGNDVSTKPVEKKAVSFDDIEFDQDLEADKAPSFLYTKPEVQEERVMPSMNDEQPMRPAVYKSVVQEEPVVEKPKSPSFKRKYVKPSLSLLETKQNEFGDEPEWLETKKDLIVKSLELHGVPDCKVVGYTYGPTVTRFEISIPEGVSVGKISRLDTDLQRSLAAKSIRIEAPIPGRTTVGIEVNNDETKMVHFVNVVNDEKFLKSNKPLLVGLGMNIDGDNVYLDLAKMPHGLVAGSSGSGKSVCVNTILVSLLLKQTPDDVKLILIDPKMVELNSYNDIPHLITPVIYDASMAEVALKWACEEMDRRYMKLMHSKTVNIEAYNNKALTNPELEKMPYIVMVIDEFSDLIGDAPEIGKLIQRLVQKARAAGMHVLLATQRPDAKIMVGSIKTNISTRIAFRVSSSVDSGIILDQPGAEKLLGRGDMLIKGADSMERVQGAYLDSEEIDKITDFIKQNNETNFVFTHDDLIGKGNSSDSVAQKTDSSEETELLYSAAVLFVENNNCSINGLLNTFGMGFNKAKQVVTRLEQLGIVSESKGTTSRKVLATMEDVERIFSEL